MTVSYPFPARYDGKCAVECGSRIHAGDMVQYVEGQLAHHGCIPDEREPDSRPVCGECFMEKAVNVACDCEVES